MLERIDTLIVGGGQAGLATSYYLAQYGREHLVLERAAQPANPWRNERWDSFTLVTPNWTLQMPGAEHGGPDRDGFMPRDELVTYFEQYVQRFQLPVQYDTGVDSVEPLDGGGYCVQTPGRAFEADNVVIATGHAQSPRIPAFASGLSPDVTQLHTGAYRNPGSLPPGAVLVAGSAQSGCQIAEELYQSGRQVFLSTGGASRVPRRYRGKDAFEWLYLTGFFEMTPDKLPMPRERFAPPHVSGKNGGHTLSLHQFARDGVTLLGHVRGAADHTVSIAPDLHENLAKADGFEARITGMADQYVHANGLDSPAEELPRLRDGFDQPILEQLDLADTGIGTVIWATGYTFDFGLVKLPVFDDRGFPLQTRGVAGYPGLYFVGMMWMPSLKTGILIGVNEAALHVAENIVRAVPISGAARTRLGTPHA
jgi:putative flavoprotein involved in K+ transport